MSTLFLERERADGRPRSIAFDDRGSGPLVIAMTGMGSLRSQYDAIADKLVASGYRVVTTDLRGFGESSAEWDDYSQSAVADDYLALVRHLDAGPAVLVASSYSAGAATQASVREPALVHGIVLLGGNYRQHPSTFAGRLLIGTLATAPARVIWRPYYKGLYPSTKPAGFAEHVAAVTANLKEQNRWRSLGRMLKSDNTASNDAATRVAVPALVIFGDKDPDFKDAAAEAAFASSSFTGETEVLIVPGVGHYPHAERPDLVLPSIESFLERTCHARA